MMHSLFFSQVIQTLSGCYTGEFPHLPVHGTGRTCSLQGGRKDLISLRDLRRQPRPHVNLTHPHNFNDQNSPVRVVPSPLHTDPLTYQLEGLPHSPASSHLYTSSESLVFSVESEAKDCWRERRDADDQLTRTPTEGMEVETRDEVDFQLEERHQEEEEESDGMDGREVEDTDTEEERTTKQEVEAWCGCRAYGEGLQRGTVHDANTFMIDTSQAEWGEVSER